MIVYESIKSEFINDVENDLIAKKILDSYIEKIGQTTLNEIRSWENSMQYMYKVLVDGEIPSNCGIAIEYMVPSTSKRVDFIISGENDDSPNIIIVELKQWERASKVEGKDGIVSTYVGGGVREVTHPSYQAWSYASLIEDYNEGVRGNNIQLNPCAYLHNYKIENSADILDSFYDYHIEKAPVFLRGDVNKLRNFIKKYIKYGDDKANIYHIENGTLKPSKSLQDALVGMLQGNKEFIMIDDQKVAFENIKEFTELSQQDEKKRVIVVEGGPGTGKSVIAINLLVEMTASDLVVQYVTRNQAPRMVYSSKLKGTMKKKNIDNLFKGSGSYVDCEEDLFDLLIVDEAHRLNEKSGMFKNLGENQIKEIIASSKCSVFFIDEFQKIDIYDAGSIDEITKYADDFDAEIMYMKLESQFRCNGSDGFVQFIEDALQMNNDGRNPVFDDESYDFRVMNTPNELHQKITELNSNNKARMLAGYCWDWNKESKNNPSMHDIQIGDYSSSWNLNNTTTWAIDPESVSQVGCIHTSQGLEFEYVGVIIGQDIRLINGKIVTFFENRASTDKSLWGIKGIAKKDYDKAMEISDPIIRNTYRTLLTRGQKGCYIYCVDNELQQYFKELTKT